jgi:glycosyltransferase involved in cell wall biosynthesis
MRAKPRIALVANTDWYLFNFRRDLARELRDRCGAEVLCISPEGQYRPRLQAEGFQWAPLRLSRQGVNPFKDIMTVQDLTRLYRQFKPDLVHHFTLKPVLYGSIAAARAGVPRVVNALAGLGTVFSGTTLKGRLLNFPVSLALKRLLGRQGSLCILQNSVDASLIENFFPGRTDLVHLIRGSGVDAAKFHPQKNDQEAPYVVLFVGRLLKDKGVMDFCKAAALVHARAPRLEFWIVGSIDLGNPASHSEAELAALGQGAPYLRFLGHQESMVEMYQKALVLVLPTCYGEGVPRSLVEGAACGLPLIATDHPGCREIVIPDANGFLVPQRDPETIAARILALAEDPHRQQSLGRESRRIALEGFSFEQVFCRTLQVYSKLGMSFNPLEHGGSA